MLTAADYAQMASDLTLMGNAGGMWALAPYACASFTNLADLGVTVHTVTHRGMPPLDPIASAAAVQGMAVAARRLELRGLVREQMAARRAQLIDLLKPDRVADGATPAVLRYTGTVRSIDLKVVLAEEPQQDDADTLIVPLVAHDPYWYATATTTVALAARQVISGSHYVLERSATGVWAALGAGPGGRFTARSTARTASCTWVGRLA